MSNNSDSTSPVSDDTKTNGVTICIDAPSEEVTPEGKDCSPSIDSTIEHISVPPTVNGNHSSSDISIAHSTATFDVNDGAVRIAEIANHSKKKLRADIFLCVAITILIGLVLTPIILFYTRPVISNPFGNTATLSSCQAVCTTYNSQVCGVRNYSQLFQFEDEASAESNLSGIASMTNGCAIPAMDFFCNAVYHSCNDIVVKPSSVECKQLKNDFCRDQWTELQNIFPSLSECDLYDRCPDQFLLTCGIACVPKCSEFSQNERGETIVVTVVIGLLSNCGNVIGGILVFIIAFFKGKTMFHFPQILILYSTATIAIMIIIVTASYFGRDVLCSDDNLFLAIEKSTSYCEIYGFTFHAGLLIFSGFWLLFVIHLFMKIVFPIRSRHFDSYKHRTKIHAAEIIVVLLIGIVIPAIVVGTTEYTITNFPPTQCAANADVTFYTLILPTIFMQFIGVGLILFSFVSIHKRKGLFRRSQGKKIRCIEFSTPEVKLLLVFLYITLVNFVYWADFSVQLRNRDSLSEAISNYVTCVNIKPANACDAERDEVYAISSPALTVISLLLISLVNFSNVVFVLQFRDVKQRLRTLTRKFTSRSSMDTPNKDKSHKSEVNQSNTS